MSKKTIHFVSLGCPKNRVDSEVMLGVAEKAGYTHVAAAEDARREPPESFKNGMQKLATRKTQDVSTPRVANRRAESTT